MMDICGEVEKLENTIKDYVEEDIKKKEILNILAKFFVLYFYLANCIF